MRIDNSSAGKKHDEKTEKGKENKWYTMLQLLQ